MTVVPALGLAEPLSSLTHLAGGVVALLFAPGLVRQGRTVAAKVTLALFVLGVTSLLFISGAYHLVHPTDTSRVALQHLDHAAIWALIAATFTPVHTIAFRGPMRWGMLLLIWGIAITGIIFKTMFFSALPESVGLMMYLGMGWLGVITIVGLARGHNRHDIGPFLWGGIVYTIGAVVSIAAPSWVLADWFGRHEFFHIAVLGGIGLHWWFISTRVASLQPA